MSRTNGTPTSTTKGTIFGWFKRGELSTTQALVGTNATYDSLHFQTANDLYVQTAPGRARITSQVFRDPTGWMPFTFSFDTTNTAGGTPKQQRLWIGLTEVTAFSTDQDASGISSPQWFANTVTQYIGRSQNSGNQYFDGLFAQTGWIDGQELVASDFFEQNADGVVVPKSASAIRTAVSAGGGARNGWGLQGSFLMFNDATSTTTLGYDRSQSDTDTTGNNWTLTNISTTAGVTYDAMTDTPTNNYATINPLRKNNVSWTVSEANLRVYSGSASNNPGAVSSLAMRSGKWYWEVTIAAIGSGSHGIGIQKSTYGLENDGTNAGYTSADTYHYLKTGNKQNGGSGSAYGASYTTSDVIGVGFDADSGTLEFFKNGASQGTAFTGIGLADWTSWASPYNGGDMQFNFGQRPFAYTNAGTDRPASTYKSLCTANLPSVAITKPTAHFDVTTWVSTQADAKTVTGLAFQPDFFWAKERVTGRSHNVFDSVRGVTKSLRTDGTDAEQTIAVSATGKLKTFNSDGYTFGADTDASYGSVNYGTTNHVGWNWKAGGTPSVDNSAGAGNTPTAGSVKIDGANLGSALAGTIAATRLSANTTAGFSIVTYTGTGANATVGHGLGVAPKMVVVKCRDQTNKDWMVWHDDLTADTKALFWNSTAAETTDATYWNSTPPTSSVFSVGSNANTNGNTFNYVAYCFAEIAGYSKFGSYVGNSSSDGAYVHLGFRPRFLMIKIASGSTGDWVVIDSKRDGYNEATKGNAALFPNTSGAESYADTGSGDIDIVANGFKPRSNNSNVNSSSGTYVYMAFAEHPFGGSNVAPSPAR